MTYCYAPTGPPVLTVAFLLTETTRARLSMWAILETQSHAVQPILGDRWILWVSDMLAEYIELRTKCRRLEEVTS